MKVLIVGGGGREHALAWKAAQSPAVEQVYVAPGNAGTAREPQVENLPVAATDVDALLTFARSYHVDLTIVGPEAPLVAGIVDAFEAEGYACFGPQRRAAQLEGSKAFAKGFLENHGIPTATYRSFTETGPALDYLHGHAMPVVIKADGLASGKGVTIAQDAGEAQAAIRDMLADSKFGDAGQRVVIEEYLQGEEASFMVIADGEAYVPLASSQDHKARDDGDQGPNTGGMGAYSPAPVVSAAIHDRIQRQVIEPTLQGLAAEGIHYRGFLYAGLMILPDGTPKVLEFNCRFGDPEAQPILMRLQSDIVGLCQAACQGELDSQQPAWDKRPALGVVLAAAGYPGTVAKGAVINGLDTDWGSDIKVFHAGTELKHGEVVTAGGRVLCVTALGDTIAAARDHAYTAVAGISWDGVSWRSDIGHHALDRDHG